MFSVDIDNEDDNDIRDVSMDMDVEATSSSSSLSTSASTTAQRKLRLENILSRHFSTEIRDLTCERCKKAGGQVKVLLQTLLLQYFRLS